jgi:hypothetical protein
VHTRRSLCSGTTNAIPVHLLLLLRLMLMLLIKQLSWTLCPAHRRCLIERLYHWRCRSAHMSVLLLVLQGM